MLYKKIFYHIAHIADFTYTYLLRHILVGFIAYLVVAAVEAQRLCELCALCGKIYFVVNQGESYLRCLININTTGNFCPWNNSTIKPCH